VFRATVCKETTQIELSSEIKMSLSFISSGCLAVPIGDKTAFVLKESQSEIEMLRGVEQILYGLECIKRPEFPSVRMYFEIRDRENKSYQFDCFFGIESDEEVRLLRELKDQDSFNIIFFDSEIGYSRRVKISEEQREKIKSVLDEAER